MKNIKNGTIIFENKTATKKRHVKVVINENVESIDKSKINGKIGIHRTFLFFYNNWIINNWHTNDDVIKRRGTINILIE